MKYLVLVFSLLLAISLSAVVRTVDNNNPSAGQYSTVQAAINASNNDDVIYVYPSNIVYAGFTVNRRMKIYGVGWHASTVNLRKTTISGTVDFTAGAEYSVLSGFAGNFYAYMNGVVGNVRLENCSFTAVDFNTVSSNASNYTISSCFFYGGGTYNNWIAHQSSQTGILIMNCIFTGTASIMSNASSNTTIINTFIQTTNKVFDNSNSIPNLRNNYIIATGYTGTNTFPSDPVIAFNMSSTAIFPTGTTNQNSIPLNTAFDTVNYRPIAGSPAINAGDPTSDYNDLDGSRNDIGAFGGPYPYRDNGFTPLPTITDVSGTLYTSPSQGLQIHVEAVSEH
ncbi:MAG: hypothetical protein CVU50_06485 [Candidatus Cloacimonetes bacterium HGW-Cloacimonetes-3]|jgi:hypothetical protein|nr:MAG: hypothetical protein CVU50_06485 [Candidatus Cloacimonetes bacterium HGW-Cloacimonetes-3]